VLVKHHFRSKHPYPVNFLQVNYNFYRMSLVDRVLEWVTREENLVRILKYWWLISTIRIAIGIAIFFIIVFGIFEISR